MTIQNALLGAIFVALVVVATVLWAYLVHCKRIRKKVEAERKEREEKEAARKFRVREQREIGMALFTRLGQAASKNKVANLLSDGTAAPKIGLVNVHRIENNAGRFTIVASIPNPTIFNSSVQVICCLDIDLEKKGKEISLFRAAYGPERSYAISELVTLEVALCNWIKEYRMFSDPRPNEEIFKPTEATK